MKTCTIDWCDKKHEAKWYCSRHYYKFLRHWDANFKKMKKEYIKKTPKEKSTKNPLYSTYQWMKTRIYNPNAKAYKNYWWRGITICDRWLWKDWFTNFYNDMGDRPDWHTLDRINNDWNYCPENCKWSIWNEQTSNTSRNNKIPWVSYVPSRYRYVALITLNKKTIHLWYFLKENDAVNARINAEIKYLWNTINNLYKSIYLSL